MMDTVDRRDKRLKNSDFRNHRQAHPILRRFFPGSPDYRQMAMRSSKTVVRLPRTFLAEPPPGDHFDNSVITNGLADRGLFWRFAVSSLNGNEDRSKQRRRALFAVEKQGYTRHHWIKSTVRRGGPSTSKRARLIFAETWSWDKNNFRQLTWKSFAGSLLEQGATEVKENP
jgi:hypothetical protein